MSEEILLEIGSRIKEIRQRKKITADQLAGKAGVSKALISQIENNRTVPSLPVLLSLMHSLGENFTSFFEGMDDLGTNGNVFLIPGTSGTSFQKEPSKGLKYKRLVTHPVYAQTIDVVLLEVEKGAGRKKMITTDAWECKYLVKGKIEYQVEERIFTMQEGDSLLFDGRKPHRLKNIGQGTAQLFIIYLF